VYVGFGAHADRPPWHGWVFAYRTNPLALAGVYVTTRAPNNGGGLWQAGNGLVADASGFVYFSTGNGDFNGPPPPQDTRNSYVKLRLQGSSLDVVGSFPPVHRRDLDACDIDLGSAGPVIVPGTRRLIGAGKEGVLYLLDMDTMQELQHFQATFRLYPPDPDFHTCPNDGYHFGVMYFYPHVHGSPVLWPIERDVSLFYIWAEQDALRSFVYDPAQGVVDVAAISAVKAPANSMPGGVLTLSANGSAPGTGIVWATRPVDCSDNNSVAGMGERSCNGENKAVQGILHAFDATTLDELWNSEASATDKLGLLAKFSPPTVAHGKVYVATSGDPSRCSDLACPGQLLVYGVQWGK
jgi:outer membrane protein assembly factor BamB